VPARDCQISAGTRSVTSTDSVPLPALRTEAEATAGKRLHPGAQLLQVEIEGRHRQVERQGRAHLLGDDGAGASIDRTLMRNSGRSSISRRISAT
jgi:hypothetical protein